MTNRLFVTLGFAAALLLAAAGCDLLGERESQDKIELSGKLVFAASRVNEEGRRLDDGNIYTMNADGSNLQQLTNFGNSGGAINPAWSPDGQTIAFANGYEATTLGPYLYLMDADGSNQRFFKRYPSGIPRAVVGWDPTWSPDGKRIAFSSCWNCERGGRNYEVSVVDVAGEEYTPKDYLQLTDHPASDGGAVWSPNGKQLAFASGRAYFPSDDRRKNDLYIVNADGSNMRRLTKKGRVEGLKWSPDGEQIVIDVMNSEIVLLNLSNNKTESLQVKAELSEGYRFYVVEWGANGNLLLLASRYSNGKDRLVLLNPETGQTKDIPFPSDYELRGIDWFVEAKL